MHDQNKPPVAVRLLNSALVYVEVSPLSGPPRERDVVDAQRILSFEGVRQALEGIAVETAAALRQIKPDKAIVEFGIEVALESGQLTAILVKGSGTANLKVTLEWADSARERESAE